MQRVCQDQAPSLVNVVKASSEVDQLGIFQMMTAANHPFEVSVSVNVRPLNFTVDTGASVSLVSKQTWCRLGCPVLTSVHTTFAPTLRSPSNLMV